ncbi:MAG: hypothetical protein ABI317_16615, partial [Gaiellales bacterium]
MTQTEARLSSPTPTTSSRTRRGEVDSGMKRSAPSNPSTPTGTLIRKIIRQPARIGPQIAAIPITGPNAPNAPPISSGGNTVLITPRPCGIRSAPNAPCSA